MSGKVFEKFAKQLAYAIPVIAFTVFLPISEYAQTAQTVSAQAQPQGIVLGAFTRSTDPNPEQRDFYVANKTVVRQVSFDQTLNVNAKSVLVYEPHSQQTLVQQNADQKLPIASLTKLMTALVAEQDPDFSKPITIAGNDVLNVAPVIGVKPGDSVKPADLLKAMLVGSANDAAWTLANHFGGQEQFVNKMNAMAEQLGMKDTHYSNPVGFDSDQNYSTAQDLKILAEYAVAHLPYQEIWQNNNYSFVSEDGRHYAIKNSNKLVFSHSNIKSIKTGQTPEALGNMIVEATNDQGNKVVAIVLGSDDRDDNTIQVINYVYKAFSWD